MNEFLQEKLTVHETAKVCSDYKWEEKHKYDWASREFVVWVSPKVHTNQNI